MQTSKRVIALAAAVVLMLSAFTGCSRGGKQPQQDENAALLLDQWQDILQMYEQATANILWAYDHAGAFLEENHWDSLLKARAAAGAALKSAEEMPAPEYTLTEEQTAALLQRGIEADIVTMEYDSAQFLLSARQGTLTLLNTHLNNDMFLEPSVEMFASWLDSSRKITELESRYMWLTTNYLLLQADAQEYWEQWLGEFPVLASAAPSWETDPDALMAKVDSLLDEKDAELVNYEKYLGTGEYTYQLVADAINTGDLSALARELNDISGVPGYFLVPDWLPEVIPSYLYTDPETEEKVMYAPGGEITHIPSACYIACAGVALEDVQRYADYLSVCGLAPYVDWDEQNQVWQLLVYNGESAMMTEWTQERTVLFLTEPVGCLIPELYYAAMLSD